MDSAFLESLLILALILLNGLLSLSEAAMLSSRRSKLEILARRGNRNARAAMKLLNDPTRLLSTVQVGITLLGILTGVFAGATISRELAAALQPSLGEYAVTVSFTLVVVVTTYLSLVLGELFPKRLAISRPERIASISAPVLLGLSRALRPAVAFLSTTTEALARMTGTPAPASQSVSTEELKLLLEQGVSSGEFAQAEREIVERVFRLGDRRAVDVMVPRVDVEWIDISASRAEILERISTCRHSPVPVGRGSLDDILGVVYPRELLGAALERGEFNLQAHVRPALFVPESLPALKVLEEFKRTHRHSAVVVDEHGGTSGIVTVADVAEDLVGEISASGAREPEPIILREDGSWLVEGRANLDELREKLAFQDAVLPDLEGVHTAGGFVMRHLGRVPVEAESFTLGGYRFEIVDMDGNRIDKILIQRQQAGS
jgi:putative hemolysin